MKNIIFLISFILLPGISISQTNLPKNGIDFVTLINAGYNNFNVPYNSGQYYIVIDTLITISDDIVINFTEPEFGYFIRHNKTSVTFNGVTFKSNNYDDQNRIIINLNHPADINITNSEFNNLVFLNIRYGKAANLFIGSDEPILNVFNNKFTNDNFRQTNYLNLIQIHRGKSNIQPNDVVKIKNINITNNEFLIKRPNRSNWSFDDFVNDELYSIAIWLHREYNTDYISNININENKFYLNDTIIDGYDHAVAGVIFHNMPPKANQDNIAFINFQGDYLFEENSHIAINNNEFYTKAKYSRGAIILMGPYRHLEINENIIKGFSRYKFRQDSTDSTKINYEPLHAVVLYGARDIVGDGTYSYDFKDVLISKNVIETKSAGIGLSGARDVTISENLIKLIQEEDFSTDFQLYSLLHGKEFIRTRDRDAIGARTAAVKDTNTITRNILIKNNMIDVNNQKSGQGINLRHVGSIDVINNEILNVNSYGIKHSSESIYMASNRIKEMRIIGNIISINQEYGSLYSYRNVGLWANDSEGNYNSRVPFGGIVFFRRIPDNNMNDIFEYNQNGNNELIIIQNNIIKKRDAQTKGVFFETAFRPNGILATDINLIEYAHNNNLNLDNFVEYNTDILGNTSNEFVDNGIWIQAGMTSNQYFYIGDFDGDGKDDFMRTSHSNGGAEVWLSRNGSFAKGYAGVWTNENNYGKWYLGDFNKNGSTDLLTINNSCITVHYSNPSNNSFDKSNIDCPSPGPQLFGQDLVIGDFNGNGYDDILAPLNVNGGAVVWLNNQNGKFQYSGVWTDAPNNGKWYVGDFNGNGRTDIMHKVNQWAGAIVYLSFPGLEENFFLGPINWNTAGLWGQDWVIGDFNGNGYSDILRPVNTDGSAQIWFGGEQLNSYSKTFDNFIFYNGEVWNNSSNLGKWYVGDFNGNGLTDIFHQLNEWAGARVYLNNWYLNESLNLNNLSKKELMPEPSKNYNQELSLELFQNYPNPFNPTTVISYNLPDAGHVTLNVYNTLGQKVMKLVNNYQTSGQYTVSVDASNLASGVYLYRLTFGNQILIEKFTVLK